MGLGWVGVGALEGVAVLGAEMEAQGAVGGRALPVHNVPAP